MSVDIIPEEVVESAWKEVGAMTESGGERRINEIAETQPALLALVMADTEGLSREAHELGLYMFVVILRMFEKHFPAGLKTVDIEAVERLRDKTEEMFIELGAADELSFEGAALSYSSTQPFVMKYIAEALFEPDDEGPDLSEDDIGGLFITMKTVLDALEEVCRS